MVGLTVYSSVYRISWAYSIQLGIQIMVMVTICSSGGLQCTVRYTDHGGAYNMQFGRPTVYSSVYRTWWCLHYVVRWAYSIQFGIQNMVVLTICSSVGLQYTVRYTEHGGLTICSWVGLQYTVRYTEHRGAHVGVSYSILRVLIPP